MWVTAPDAPHAEEIKQFLGHKPGNYKWHIERCVAEVLDALETRFYVGKLNGAVITNIMTVEYEGVGILGHVFTLPKQRRKGAAKGRDGVSDGGFPTTVRQGTLFGHGLQQSSVLYLSQFRI